MSQLGRTLKNPMAYLKAISAGVTAFAGSYVTAYQSDGISQPEWVVIASATVVAAVGVFFTPNKDRKGEVQDTSVQPPQL